MDAGFAIPVVLGAGSAGSERFWTVEAAGSRFGASSCWAEASGVANPVAIGTVSYTHLDVYKRQV